MYEKNPETSLIIRTFNEEKRLGALLKAVKEQDYKDYEIIIIDSGSTDKTLEIAKESADKILNIESRDFTFGYSLNEGCRQCQGKYIVFISAHAKPVDSRWLSRLLAPFNNEKVGMVYGGQIGSDESKFSEKRDLKRFSSPNNANSAIRKALWQKMPFDEYLFGLEDIEWAKHITSADFLVHFEPEAVIYHIHQEKWPQVFNRYRREAIAAARIGLLSPPQAGTGIFWFANNIFQDVLASLPNVSPQRMEEVFRFRYFQWKGSRQGWFNDRNLNINRDRYALFYPAVSRAVMIKNKHQAKIEEVSLPEMKPGDILIQVNYVGVCRTDLEIYNGSLGYYKQDVAKYPIVPGHEFSGVIVKIGANNRYRERFKTGDRVVGECILSRDDLMRKEVGVINHNGAYSQFIVMPGSHIHKIPEGLSQKTACLTEPLAVVLRAIRRAQYLFKQNANIAVIGAGPIGNLCAQTLVGTGRKVSVFDRNKERLDIFQNNAINTFQAIDGLEKFDAIVEATGDSRVLEKILADSRMDTAILLLGFPYGGINYNFEDLVGKEKTIIGSLGADSEDFEKALNLLSCLDTDIFTENVLPLEEFAKAWELQEFSKHLKIILEVKKES